MLARDERGSTQGNRLPPLVAVDERTQPGELASHGVLTQRDPEGHVLPRPAGWEIQGGEVPRWACGGFYVCGCGYCCDGCGCFCSCCCCGWCCGWCCCTTRSERAGVSFSLSPSSGGDSVGVLEYPGSVRGPCGPSLTTANLRQGLLKPTGGLEQLLSSCQIARLNLQ